MFSSDRMRAAGKFLYQASVAASVVAVLLVAGQGLIGTNAAEAGRAIPAPTADEAAKGTSAIAVFAGGCFWGVQGVFQHTEGVTNAVSGYAGGTKATASYQIIGSGLTGHAEAVQIAYDPRKISYGRLLQIFFSVAHDPTQLNRQGPDSGTQYRSAIFPMNAEQANTAMAYIAQLDKSKVFPAAIVTKIESDKPFYPAEDYHQDYMTLHPSEPYIAYNDLPKIGELKRFFPAQYREKPALVSAAQSPRK